MANQRGNTLRTREQSAALKKTIYRLTDTGLTYTEIAYVTEVSLAYVSALVRARRLHNAGVPKTSRGCIATHKLIAELAETTDPEDVEVMLAKSRKVDPVADPMSAVLVGSFERLKPAAQREVVRVIVRE